MRDLNIFLILSILLFLVGPVYAQEQNLGDYYQGQNAELLQNCANCTSVNITSVLLGNKTLLRLNQQMSANGTQYNFTLISAYTSSAGDYIVSGVGDPDGKITIWNYKIYVSPLAINQSTSQSIGSAVFLFLMVVLMFVFGYIGFRFFKTKNWWIIGIFFIFLAALLMIYNTWLGYQYHKLFTGLPDSGVPERIFYILLFLIVLGSLTCVGLLFRYWKKVLRYVKKEIRKKESGDEDLDDWDFDRWGGENWGIKK